MKWVFLILGVLLLSLSAVVATDQVVVNAKDWREFYSVAVYSSLENSSFNFFSDSVNIQTFKETKFGLTSQDNITIFNGKGYYISGLKSIIEAGGFSVNQVYEGIENLNYYIGDELLHDIQNFVIISDSKSRAALGAIPYVLESKSYVFFVNLKNYKKIYNLISDKNYEDVVLLGPLDNEIREKFNSLQGVQNINNLDLFEDNLEINQMFIDLKDKIKAALISNGDVFEIMLLSSDGPLILTGYNTYPPSVTDFIKKNNIKSIFGIGAQMITVLKSLREKTKVAAAIKFGQGNSGGEQKDLDVFRFPIYESLVSIQKARYNTATKEVEILFQNVEKDAAYFQSLKHRLFNNETNETIKEFGDETFAYIEGGSKLAILYDMDLSYYSGDELALESELVWGEYPRSTEFLAKFNNLIDFFEFEDNSDLSIIDAIYNPGKQRFEITVQNSGEVSLFTRIEIEDITINKEVETLTSEIVELMPNQPYIFRLNADLDDFDYQDNYYINVIARFSENEDALIKKISEELPLVVKEGFNPALLIIVALVVIFILLLIGAARRRKNRY